MSIAPPSPPLLPPEKQPFRRTWSEEVTRVVFISDTHCQHSKILGIIPQGDVLVHSGDFSFTGRKSEVEEFRDFLLAVPHPVKVVVAGNHDLTFHATYYEALGRDRFHSRDPPEDGPYIPHECKTIITSLQDHGHQVYYLENKGMDLPGTSLRVWGSPWTPDFNRWAFNYKPRGKFCQELFRTIPEGVDIVITHGPPFKVGDEVVGDEGKEGDHVGCPELLREVKTRVKPRIHIFGHIHECHGVFQDEEGILYLNASTCTLDYEPINPPIVVDIPNDRTKPIQVVSEHHLPAIPIDLSGSPWDKKEEEEEEEEGTSDSTSSKGGNRKKRLHEEATGQCSGS